MTRPSTSTSVFARYALAVVLVLGALLGTILVNPEHLFSPLFLLAILVSAWFGGTGPGMLASVMAVLAIKYAFLPPRYSWSIKPSDLLQLIVFFVSAVAIAGGAVGAGVRRMPSAANASRSMPESESAPPSSNM